MLKSHQQSNPLTPKQNGKRKKTLLRKPEEIGEIERVEKVFVVVQIICVNL